MVTPPECSTTLISTSSGLLRRARLTAVTSTSDPEAGSASMPPLTPLISIVAPAATRPCQWKSSAHSGGERAIARTARVAAWRVFIAPPIIDPPAPLHVGGGDRDYCLRTWMLPDRVCTFT